MVLMPWRDLQLFQLDIGMFATLLCKENTLTLILTCVSVGVQSTNAWVMPMQGKALPEPCMSHAWTQGHCLGGSRHKQPTCFASEQAIHLKIVAIAKGILRVASKAHRIIVQVGHLCFDAVEVGYCPSKLNTFLDLLLRHEAYCGNFRD